MPRCFNFSAGPAAIPLSVLEKAQAELLNWKNTGASIMEVSHRSKEFIALGESILTKLRTLLRVPTDYEILLMHGGGRAQFAAIPLNLLGQHKTMNYAITGHWSKDAAEEAKRFGQVHIATNNYPKCHTIADAKDWDLAQDAAYLYYCDNETVHGLEFSTIPAVKNQLLVADMSSNMLSRPVDVTRFGLIFACAQKNLGPTGATLVLVRKDLIGKTASYIPSILDYKTFATSESMPNTPVTFSWYIMGLTLDWIIEQGGLEKIAAINLRKAQKLYSLVDESSLYFNDIDPNYRSRMNVIFRLPTAELETQFVQQATQQGLAGLKGHRAVGGLRASIYNAVSEEAVDALSEFMREFERKNG